eukprot:5189981-Pyramimonas_sp.AAC.1
MISWRPRWSGSRPRGTRIASDARTPAGLCRADVAARARRKTATALRSAAGLAVETRARS